MFNTLRSNRISDGPYSVQPTSPPFDKKRQRKLARLACVNCRVSKVRCSGEQAGCQRCSVKAIDCCYPATHHSGRASKPSKRNTLPDKTGSQSNKPPEQDETPDSSVGILVYGFQDTFHSQFELTQDLFSHHIPAIDVGKSPLQSATHEYCYGVLPSDLRNYRQHEDNRDAGSWQSTTTADTALASPIFDSFANVGSQVDSDPIESVQSTLAETPFGMDGFCFCYSDAISLYEHIQMTLVWKMHDKTCTADTLLQDQKKALSDCGSLLRCKSCKSQSKYITLLTSMCEKILSSMETLCQIRPSCFHQKSRCDAIIWVGVEEDSANINCTQSGRKESFRSEATYGPQQRQPQENWHFDETVAGDVSGRRFSDHRNGEADHKVTIGEWQLDDDDEISVFRGLVSARVARLSGLVATLEGIANEHQWSHQSSHLRDTRERCNSLSHRLGVST